MGLCKSRFYHDEEKGLDDNLFMFLNYGAQPEEEYKQLDTENDQKGDTAVEHIFKKTKTVYGQPPKDMKGMQINWKTEYGIELKKRPCPYDFPAFQGDKPPDYDEKKKEQEQLEKQAIEKSLKSTPVVAAESKQPAGEKEAKRKSRSKSKSKPKKPRRSANEALDQCSLSE